VRFPPQRACIGLFFPAFPLGPRWFFGSTRGFVRWPERLVKNPGLQFPVLRHPAVSFISSSVFSPLLRYPFLRNSQVIGEGSSLGVPGRPLPALAENQTWSRAGSRVGVQSVFPLYMEITTCCPQAKLENLPSPWILLHPSLSFNNKLLSRFFEAG